MARTRSPRSLRGVTRWQDVPLSMSLEKAAEVLGISKTTLWHEVQEKRLRAVRMGGGKCVRISQDDLRSFLRGEPQGPRAEDGTLLRIVPGGIEDVA